MDGSRNVFYSVSWTWRYSTFWYIFQWTICGSLWQRTSEFVQYWKPAEGPTDSRSVLTPILFSSTSMDLTVQRWQFNYLLTPSGVYSIQWLNNRTWHRVGSVQLNKASLSAAASPLVHLQYHTGPCFTVRSKPCWSKTEGCFFQPFGETMLRSEKSPQCTQPGPYTLNQNLPRSQSYHRSQLHPSSRAGMQKEKHCETAVFCCHKLCTSRR